MLFQVGLRESFFFIALTHVDVGQETHCGHGTRGRATNGPELLVGQVVLEGGTHPDVIDPEEPAPVEADTEIVPVEVFL